MDGVPTVCYLRGTMNSLLTKLPNIKNHSNPTEDYSELIESLKEDLERLKSDFFDKSAGRRETHSQVTVWMKQVRDLVFDIEDWIDLKPDTSMVDPSHKEVINYFKTEMEDARERFTRYVLLENVPTEPDLAVAAPSKITIDLPLLDEEKICHDIFNESREKIEKHLMDKQMRLKVVSIVGMEGLGKTTLAKEIFAKLQPQGHFECQAFVSVGRRPSTRKILNDIFRQVNLQASTESENGEIQPSISDLREYLSRKRYFIIFDGIWSMRDWKVINCALPANNRGSRILTTTCITDIGKFCTTHPTDVIYQMASLSEENSRILFLSRISGLEKEKLSHFEEDTWNLLDICGGMPLAITVAAGLFARKSEEMAESKMLGKSEEMAELRMLGKSVISSPKQCSAAEGMKKILEVNFTDLSLPARSCLLYLSIFPENYTIKKDRLIRLWEAEGFIPRRDKECLWVTGERYFSELISRGLIQAVFDYDDDGEVGCTIHSVILDFIIALSRQENFSTRAAELSCGLFPCETIRRFSLDRSNEVEANTIASNNMHLSSMRSLTVFGDAEGIFDPPISLHYEDNEDTHFRSVGTVTGSVTHLSFKLMRVLDLEDTKKLSVSHLEGIGGLVLLRYLGLRGTGVSDLPRELRELAQLETLDMRKNGPIRYIGRFPKLVRLLGDINTKHIDRIWEMPELEEVSMVRGLDSSSLCRVRELLTSANRLRMLGVTLDILGQNPILSFRKVVKSNRYSMPLDCFRSDDNDGRLLDSRKKKTVGQAVNFELKLCDYSSGHGLSALPPNKATLFSLTHLRIKLYKVELKDLGILGDLPNLVHLYLTSSFYSGSGRGVIEKDAFPCLKVLLFTCSIGIKGLEFKGGAMPQLRRLRLNLKPWSSDGHVDFSFEHLKCLTQLQAIFDCNGSTVSEVETAVAHVKDQVSRNPNKPALQLRLTNQDPNGRDEGQHSRR